MRHSTGKCLAVLLAIIVIIMGIWLIGQRKICRIKVHTPGESTEYLKNPETGAYHLYQFRLGSDDSKAAENLISTAKQTEDTLCLLEIDLENYRTGDIPDEELNQTEQILSAFQGSHKKLILRFLYDWNGTASVTEPDSIDIILRHMEQLGPILLENRNTIFLLQGLFTGNWGEMNGSRYSDAENMRILASKLQNVTQHKILLSVRMPSQWRMIVEPSQKDFTGGRLSSLAAKSGIALFNDGLTGTGTDYGTYASDTDGIYESRDDQDMRKIHFVDFDPLKPWPRDPELLFQEKICTRVPNGGEAIHPSEWNDLDQAIRSFKRMHISYLNLDYDADVWKKWASEKVSTKDAFDGMQGDIYITRHLGYRYVLSRSKMQYHWGPNKLSAGIKLVNKGFAPAYEPITVQLMLMDADGHVVRQKNSIMRPESLPGGNKMQKAETFSAEFSAKGLSKGHYKVAVRLMNADHEPILLGNKGRQKDSSNNPYYSFGTVDINE